MSSTNVYPDRITQPVLAGIERSVSAEIAASVVTTAYLDGSARQRRDLRILARRLNGITAKYGVTLEEAIKRSKVDTRLVVVTLEATDSAIEPIPVETSAAPTSVVEPTPAVVSSPVVRTVRGHHFAFSDPRNEVNDHVCRSCGTSGHFGYILDRTPCAAPYFGTESLDQVA